MNMWRIINLIAAGFLALWFAPKFFITHIEPWEIGVQQSVLGGKALTNVWSAHNSLLRQWSHMVALDGFVEFPFGG